MRSTAVIRGFGGILVAVVAAWAEIRAQEPGGTAASKPAASAPRTEPGATVGAVDRLVEQLRRYPARPATSAGQVGLFLIEAEGGKATRIANEPDPWLDRCGSPAWSHDGKQILFEATTGTVRPPAGPPTPISRLKALDLVDGRLEIKDLGPGSHPDHSPSDDRIVLLLNRGSQVGGQQGVWLMRADGTERRLLGGYGRPKWSPGGSQFLIIS